LSVGRSVGGRKEGRREEESEKMKKLLKKVAEGRIICLVNFFPETGIWIENDFYSFFGAQICALSNPNIGPYLNFYGSYIKTPR